MGSQPIKIQLGKILQEILWEIVVVNCCGKILQEILVGNFLQEILWEIPHTYLQTISEGNFEICNSCSILSRNDNLFLEFFAFTKQIF